MRILASNPVGHLAPLNLPRLFGLLPPARISLRSAQEFRMKWLPLLSKVAYLLLNLSTHRVFGKYSHKIWDFLVRDNGGGRAY